MGWLQSAAWREQHVRESVTALKEKRAGDFAALLPLKSFKEIGL
ncbi:hypothetical protein [Polaromonas jejuensis]|uniref:Uncharacterized protein n=1 Tax=Polaromonas jejuensis TaxID=457502 RepID=A0ABW0QC87_9BURK